MKNCVDMKLQLNEKTLNAYISAALNEEMGELFGSRVRKANRAYRTGKPISEEVFKKLVKQTIKEMINQ